MNGPLKRSLVADLQERAQALYDGGRSDAAGDAVLMSEAAEELARLAESQPAPDSTRN
jgi:hypothetical protein